jgi:aconitate hydratase
MAPEYGATCGFFPVDDETLRYLRNTGRAEERVALVEAYAKAQGMWREADYDPVFTDTLELDLATSCRPWPARSARRTAWTARSAFSKALEFGRGASSSTEIQEGARPAAPATAYARSRARTSSWPRRW